MPDTCHISAFDATIGLYTVVMTRLRQGLNAIKQRSH